MRTHNRNGAGSSATSRALTVTFSVAFALGAVLLTSGPASAQSKPGTATPAADAKATVNVDGLSKENKEIFECVETQASTTQDFVSCAKAPSPILPAPNELIWGTFCFFVLLAAMAKFGYPALRKGMDGRTERIRADLARADEAKGEAEVIAADYAQRLASAKQEATRIIEDARATADALKAELAKRAEVDIAAMRERAQGEIVASKGQAMEDLKGEVAQLAIRAAEMVVEKSLDSATQVQLVENYIAAVAAQN